MATAKENLILPVPTLKHKASLSDQHGRHKPNSSPERLSSTTKIPSPSHRDNLPKSFIKTLGAIALQQPTVGRAQIEHVPAFTRIFEKRSPTVPKAPKLHTETRALVRSRSPGKMAPKKSSNPSSRASSAQPEQSESSQSQNSQAQGTNDNASDNVNIWPTRPENWDAETTNRAITAMSPFFPNRQLQPQTRGLGGNSPQYQSGCLAPNSSPMSDDHGRRDSASPEKDDHWQAKSNLKPRRKDDDDTSGGDAGGSDSVGGWGAGGKDSGASNSCRYQGGKSNMKSSNMQTQHSGASRAINGLCGSAAWFIPRNGRYEQLLPRYQLIHTANWYKEEGKIPCGISERAKFHQGRYGCGRYL